MTKLVIVESPSKAKTIGRYLGKEYRIAASVGHIRDLPSSTLGVDVNNDFKPRYINMKGKDQVIRDLKKQAAEADEVLLATDPDREGEAIAWHLSTILKIDPSTPCRITFNEITDKAVKEAVKHPRPIDMDLVDAQQARRVLDRLVGYELSPLLWKKIRKGLSAGRVQSVATKMLVDREREIDAFIPEEYWNLYAFLSKLEETLEFRVKYHGELQNDKVKKVDVRSQAEADAIQQDLNNDAYQVYKLKKGQRRKQPYPPYTTSTLQQDASRRMGYTSRRTMQIAQQLYEGVTIAGQGQISLVTYIRTDSVRISEDALTEARSRISSEFGEAYLPAKARYFKNKSAAQDAHEAIRPAHFDLAPEQVRYSLTNEQFRLYDLIWKRFLASQMAPALIDTVSLDVQNGSHIFRANGETIVFPGYLKLYDDTSGNKNDDKERLPELSEGEALRFRRFLPEQKFTLPPARYTEASLIKALEEEGIGRPSTYAPTISTVLERHYAEKDQKSLVPTDLGTLVTELLEDNFANIVDSKFTANMESKLDEVEAGKEDWVDVLKDFYPDFHKAIEQADTMIEKITIEPEKLGRVCPECGQGELVLREGRYGKFIACSRFPECRYTETITVETGSHCPKCGSNVVERKSKKGRLFYTCDKKGKDPDCDFISWYQPVDNEFCPVCGTYMVLRKARGQTYKTCGNPDCETNKRKTSAKKAGAGKRGGKASSGSAGSGGTAGAAANQDSGSEAAPDNVGGASPDSTSENAGAEES